MEQVKPRILIYNLTFPPDQVSTAYIVSDIALEMKKNLWDVKVYTTYPHYNFNGDFHKISKKKWLHRQTYFHDICVTHCYQSKPKGLVLRGLLILYFHVSFIIHLLVNKKPDIIFAPSPPLTSGFVVGIFARLLRIKSVYNVQEIYPDILIKINKRIPTPVYDILKFIEIATYRLNNKVVVIDETFGEKISNRLNGNKLHTIPNFVDTEIFKPVANQSNLMEEYCDKFVIAYYGNIGSVQDWDTVFSCMKLLKKHNDIILLLIGGGNKYDYVLSKSREMNNVKVLPYQQKAKILDFMAISSLHIIPMNYASDYDGLPSKALGILSYGRPIVATTSEDSPLAKLLKASGYGFRVDIGDSVGLAKEILENKLSFNERGAQQAREYIVQNYSKQVVLEKYLKLFESLIH